MAAEPTLYKDTWERSEGGGRQTYEGLRIKVAMKKQVLGWFMATMNRSTFRIRTELSGKLLAGVLPLYHEHRKRWEAVCNLGNVYIRFNQAESYRGGVCSGGAGVRWPPQGAGSLPHAPQPEPALGRHRTACAGQQLQATRTATTHYRNPLGNGPVLHIGALTRFRVEVGHSIYPRKVGEMNKAMGVVGGGSG